MVEYELIALGGIALVGFGTKAYLDIKEKKRINRFNNWVNNYFIPETNKIRELINEFSVVSKDLTNKLKDNKI
ncbi:MAG: hypothetical protein WC812_02635 [Candidatus Pacearchaeota archaeon]|jgi:RAB protein geranylgeranyltransferase component A